MDFLPCKRVTFRCDVVGTYEIYFFLIRYSRKTALSRRNRACFHLLAARGVGWSCQLELPYMIPLGAYTIAPMSLFPKLGVWYTARQTAVPSQLQRPRANKMPCHAILRVKKRFYLPSLIFVVLRKLTFFRCTMGVVIGSRTRIHCRLSAHTERAGYKCARGILLVNLLN